MYSLEIILKEDVLSNLCGLKFRGSKRRTGPLGSLPGATLRLNGAAMKKASSNGNYRRKADSQESDIVKEGITCESALREEGIDEVFVARKLKELLRAQRQRWNPKKRSWDKFEDYDTQLAALSESAKTLCMYRKDLEGGDVQVLIDMSVIPPKRRPELSLHQTTNSESE
jgi:hypothetical protein